MAQLRILMTTDAVGGVWTYALDLARGLAALDIETVLAAMGPDPDAAQADAARWIPGLTLIATGLPLDWTAGTRDELLRAARGWPDCARTRDPRSSSIRPPWRPVLRSRCLPSRFTPASPRGGAR